MDCSELREYFSDFFDGELPSSTSGMVKVHLLACPDCRSEYKKFSLAIQAVRHLPELKAPAGFVDRVMREVESQKVVWWKKAASYLDRGLDMVPMRALTAAAALLLVVSLIIAYQSGNKSSLNFAFNHKPTPTSMPSTLASNTEPMPVEFASTNPSASSPGYIQLADSTNSIAPDHGKSTIYFNTPNELVMFILKRDPAFNKFAIYPHPRGIGALVHSPDALYEIMMDPAEFPMIQAYIEQQGGKIPATLREARTLYPIYIHQLPSPLAPLPPGK